MCNHKKITDINFLFQRHTNNYVNVFETLEYTLFKK